MKERLLSLMTRDDGQTLVEYALIIGLVAIALIVALGLLAGGIDSTFDNIISKLPVGGGGGGAGG